SGWTAFAEHLGLDRARGYRVHGDAAGCQLTGPNASVCFQGGLRTGVWSAFGNTERGQTRHVDDAAPSRLDHAGQCRLHHLHRSTDIHVVGGRELVEVDGADTTEPREADVVDHRIDPAFCDYLVERGRGRGSVAEVYLVELPGKVRRCNACEPNRLV